MQLLNRLTFDLELLVVYRCMGHDYSSHGRRSTQLEVTVRITVSVQNAVSGTSILNQRHFSSLRQVSADAEGPA